MRALVTGATGFIGSNIVQRLVVDGWNVVAAGMEGALPSVLAGLISKPIIAVPTSVGYGANFKGVTPLLSMLNSCSQGVAVVNIDSGFSAGCFAKLIMNQINQGDTRPKKH